MVTGILTRSPVDRVKHCRARLVFGWVTVLVCQFHVDSPLDENETEALGGSLEATVRISLWDLYSSFCNFKCFSYHFYMAFAG